jgi:hypothetical protein
MNPSIAVSKMSVEAVVVSELKFRGVRRHVLGLTLWKEPMISRLKNAPETFNRVCVDRADDVALRLMLNGLRATRPYPKPFRERNSRQHPL